MGSKETENLTPYGVEEVGSDSQNSASEGLESLYLY